MKNISTILVSSMIILASLFSCVIPVMAAPGPDHVDPPTHDGPVCIVDETATLTGDTTVLMHVTPGDDLVVNGVIRHDRGIPIPNGESIEVWAARHGNESEPPHEIIAAIDCQAGQPDPATYVDDPVLLGIGCEADAHGNNSGETVVIMGVTPGDDLVEGGDIVYPRRFVIYGLASKIFQATRDGYLSEGTLVIDALHCPKGVPNTDEPTEPTDPATHVDNPVIESVVCQTYENGNNTGDTVVMVSVTPGDDLIEGGDLVFQREFVIAGLADKHFQATRDSYLSANTIVVDALHCPTN